MTWRIKPVLEIGIWKIKYFWEGFWNKFEGLDDYKIGRRRLRREYLQRAGVPESFGAEKAKYFVLKYSHWISNKRNEPTPPNHIKINHLTGETYDDRPGSLSADGVKKYELDGLDKIFAFVLFGVPFGAEYNREKDNPQIKLFHLRTEEDYITFSYWGDNCVHFTWDYWNGREEHLQLIGEFTSK